MKALKIAALLAIIALSLGMLAAVPASAGHVQNCTNSVEDGGLGGTFSDGSQTSQDGAQTCTVTDGEPVLSTTVAGNGKQAGKGKSPGPVLKGTVTQSSTDVYSYNTPSTGAGHPSKNWELDEDASTSGSGEETKCIINPGKGDRDNAC